MAQNNCSNVSQLKYIDLFAGCGGLSLGLHNSGWKGIFAIEKNEDAFKTIEHNLINNLNHFDWPKWLPKRNHDINHIIENYKEDLINLQGKVDMVAGGPPCQGFSMIGRRKEDDVRNGLIKSYLRFIMYTRPKAIFFENVKGFTLEFKKNKSKGIAYSEYVLRVLRWFKYDVEGKMMDFSEFGIPQKRTRFILVGIRKDIVFSKNNTSNAFFTKIKENKEKFLISKDLTLSVNLKQALSDLLEENGKVVSPDNKNFNAGIYGISRSKYQKQMRKGNLNQYPDSHRFANHTTSVIKRNKLILKKCQKNRKVNQQLGEQYITNKHTLIPLDGDSVSPTLTTLPDDFLHYQEPRILTVREYARIQSFPDWYEFKGRYTTGGRRRVLEVPRYTQIGNAIPPLFGEQSGLILKEITN